MLGFISSYLQKLNSDLELAYGAPFLLIFTSKSSLFPTLSMNPVQYQTFFTLQDINQLVFKFHYQSASAIFRNGHLGKKEDKIEAQKFESHMSKRSFLHEITIFHIFLSALFL